MSDAKPPSDSPSAGKNKLVGILLALNSLLLVGVIAVLFLRPPGGGASAAPAKGDKEASAKTEEASSKEGKAEGGEHAEGGAEGAAAAGALRVGPTVKLEDFVVHLRNPEVDRYARLTLDLELGGEPDKAVITTYLPVIRDRIIAYLSDRTLEELRGSEGMGRAKGELTQQLNGLVPGSRVRNVYISNFVVQ